MRHAILKAMAPARTRPRYVAARPFALSRTKIELFHQCPRCLWLDARFGVARPSFPAFTLNAAVDTLLKKEFDRYRARGEAHPLVREAGLSLVPLRHPHLEAWRHNFTGIRVVHAPTQLEVFGAVDDIWVDPEGVLYVVDYKSTSKTQPPTIDTRWAGAYKRQVEVYQWLLRQQGFAVGDCAYFVYANATTEPDAFNASLQFTLHLIDYQGDASWVEPLLTRIKDTLESDRIPEAGKECEYCAYREAAGNTFKRHVRANGNASQQQK